MQISCLPVSIFPELISGDISIEEYAAFAAGIGLDGIDLNAICLRNHTERYLAGVRKGIEEAGVRLVMLTTYTDFTHPDEEQREREFAYAIHDMAIAAQLGAKYLRITAGQAHPDGDADESGAGADKQLETAAEYFFRCREWSEKLGVELLYENHSKPGAWDYPDILYDPENFLKFARLVRGSDIGINYDTANSWAFGADPVTVLGEVVEDVVTIHVSDMKERKTLEFTEIGGGAVPIKSVVDFARSKGFDGWLCIEEVSKQGLEGIERAVSWVKKELVNI